MQEGAVTLTLAGAIVYANQSFADLVDTPLQRVIGSSIETYVDAFDHPALQSLLADGLGTMRTRLRPGSRAPLEAHISVSHVAIDAIEHRTLIVTDLTTLTKVQRESRSKDDFLAMLAHELRNPLAPIRTGLQVLRLTPSDEAAVRVREMMERQVTQMVRLIDDLLDVSRVSQGKIELKRELIDLRTVIGMAIETNLPFIEAGRHELTVEGPDEAIIVDADPMRLAQVFGNLLNNAAKYTPDGGRLTLAVTTEPGVVQIDIKRQRRRHPARDAGDGVRAVLAGRPQPRSRPGRPRHRPHPGQDADRDARRHGRRGQCRTGPWQHVHRARAGGGEGGGAGGG